MARNNAKSIFGARLRMLRKARGMTLEELGRAASLGYKHIAHVERAEKTASFDAIGKLAKALHVPPHELFVPVHSSEGSIGRSLKDRVSQMPNHGSPAFKRFAVEVLSLVQRLELELVAESRERRA